MKRDATGEKKEKEHRENLQIIRESSRRVILSKYRALEEKDSFILLKKAQESSHRGPNTIN